MRAIGHTEWIAVDWGTTHLRSYAMSADHRVIAEAQSSNGMGKLAPGEFEPALLQLTDSWLPSGKTTIVLACGMVGARQGWVEAPYQEVPCPPLDSQYLLPVSTNDKRMQVFILPGISQAKPADVMRGEETQLAGLLTHSQNDDHVSDSKSISGNKPITVCLPGTHSKWARLAAGQLQQFTTFMTGELFALFCQYSMLRHGVDSTDWDDAAFLAGVEQGIQQPAQLLSDCFRLRAQHLLDDLPAATARSRLSGLLLGTEFAGTKTYWRGETVHIIGEKQLADLYVKALRLTGTESVLYTPDAMTLSGLKQAYQAIQPH